MRHFITSLAIFLVLTGFAGAAEKSTTGVPAEPTGVRTSSTVGNTVLHLAAARTLLNDRSLLNGGIPGSAEHEGASSLMQRSGIRFTENRGQIVGADGRLRGDIVFLADAPGAKLFFRTDGISYVFTKSENPAAPSFQNASAAMLPEAISSHEIRVQRLDMTLVNGNPRAHVRAEDVLPGSVNYYLPHCPDGITGVRQYGRIVYENVYDNIDLELFSSKGRMKYNFVVRPGGRPHDIRMRYDGASETALTDEGVLSVATPLGRMEEAAPYTWCGDESNEVGSRFLRKGNTVSFAVDEYDPLQTLVIDPWATYYGGSGSDNAEGMCVDAGGNVVVSGMTTSSNFPASWGGQSSNAGGKDAFVVKFDANGTRLWATYYGGSGDENGPKVAAGSNGTIVIAGHTTSADLPVTTGAFQSTYAGNGDVFLAQLDANGVRQWTTYYGGSKAENFPCLATDSNGDILFSGSTQSRNFPVSTSAFQTSPSLLYFVKMNANGSWAWATFFGDGHAYGITVDANNNILATGFTSSTSFPVTVGASQSSNAGGVDAFIVKLTGNGARVWASYFGGSNNDWGRGICANGSGDIFITGYTKSINLPTTPNAFQASYSGGSMDAFLTAYSSDGSARWSSYCGGSDGDYLLGISMDVIGNIQVVGFSSSADFPVSSNVFQTVNRGGEDAVVASFSSAGARNWASYFGGCDNDIATVCVSGANATMVFAGCTSSADFPTHTAFQTLHAGGSDDAFVVQLNSGGRIPGFNFPPISVATASPNVGSAPLQVFFNSDGSYDPDGTIISHSWDFGDGGTSQAANPVHSYSVPGTYTTLLTVTDNNNATATANAGITVAFPGNFVFVQDQSITRVQTGSNKWKGQDVVSVYNSSNQPVSGAVVTATYSGPNSGTTTGTTGANGTVSLLTNQKTFPVGIWCFMVTAVQAAGYTFNTSIGQLSACETAPKDRGPIPASLELSVYPNPFGAGVLPNGMSTSIQYGIPEDGTVRLRIFDLHGRAVAELIHEVQTAGIHSIDFDCGTLPGGVYFCILEYAERAYTKIVTLVR